MTSPHAKRLSPVLVALGFVSFTPIAGTLSAFAEILFARKILKNSAESFRVKVTDAASLFVKRKAPESFRKKQKTQPGHKVLN